MKKTNIFIIAILILFCLGLVGNSSAFTLDELGGIDIHGFASQGYLKSNDYNYLAHNSESGSFEYNEMGINFSKQLTDKLRLGLQLFSRDLGDVANNKITVDWAYGDYRFRDWLGLRAGRIKLPFGLYNETRDMDMLRTCIVLPQGIYHDLLRDNLIAVNGVSLYGNVGLKSAGGLSYQMLAGGITTDMDSGIRKYMNSGLAGSGGAVNGDSTNDTTYAGALQWETPLDGLKLGYSFFNTSVQTPYIFFGVLTTTFEADVLWQIISAEYTWNNLVLAAEYIHQKNDTQLMGVPTPITSISYYLSGSYTFNDWFTLGAYYAVYYADEDDKDGLTLAVRHNAWEKDLAVTLRFDINEYLVFKIEGHSVDGTANVLVGDNPDNPYSDANWYYGAAKLTFSF